MWGVDPREDLTRGMKASSRCIKEQLPLVLQFVDEAGTNLLNSFYVNQVPLVKHLLVLTSTLEKFALDLSYLRGQGYDGAGNMAGKYNGTAAIIQDSYPKATYVHCAAHSLNLCVVSACSIPAIRNAHRVLQEICIFFNYSPKRQAELERQI